jgi:hypothetical protein
MMTLAYGGEICSLGSLPLGCGPKPSALWVPSHRFCCLSPPFGEGFRSLSTISFLMATTILLRQGDL